MTTSTIPHGHSIARPFRRCACILFTALLAFGAVPAGAVTPASGMTPATNRTAATPPSLQAAAPASVPVPAMATPGLASPDNAPLGTQLAVLKQARDTPTTSSRISTVLQRAFALLGTPYRWGGTSPESGFDCSGLVGYVFRTIGIDLPRVSRAMAQEGTRVVDRSALAKGDLVFFGKSGKVDHVGIYVGDGNFVHAPRTGRDVTVSTLARGYWGQKYMEGRRIAVDS